MESYYFIFELIYRNSKYSELIQNLEELGIDKLCITSDKNKEIQTITELVASMTEKNKKLEGL